MAKNTSGSAEEYIKQSLIQSGIAEIKRSNLVDTFQVAPSQIDYVIKTRFTESCGYTIESKYGSGGYIHIARVRFSDQHQTFGNLMSNIGERISEQVFTGLIQLLFDEKITTEREGNLILATTLDDVLDKDAPEIRIRTLREILQGSDRKGFHL